MMMGSCLVLVLTGLILMQMYMNTECTKIDVTPDRNTIVIFKRKNGQGSDCSVCEGEGSSQICNSEVKLNDPVTTAVSFNCSQPGDVFTVEINQEIDCTTSCSNIDAVHPGSTRFLDFNRIFTWDVKVQSTKTVQLDFPSPGMRQIKPTEQCSNKHTYTIISYQRAGPANIGTFCWNGTIGRIRVLYKGRVSLEVPKGTELNPSDFKVSVGPERKMLLEVDAKLPREESVEDFFTPNYATGFLRDNQIKWNFAVEPVHNFTVKYPDKTEPECQKGDVSIDYLLKDETILAMTLKDEPPVNKQGDFSVTLSNCDAKKGLSLNLQVSVFRGGIPNLCPVDLKNESGLSLQIEKKNPLSYCEMKMNSLVQEKIVMPAGSKAELSFLDCSVEDLQLTATKTLVSDCASGSPCPEIELTIPTLDACLPGPLQQFTWFIRVPDQNSVDLASSLESFSLHQSTAEKECKTMTFLVSENDKFNIGQFCSIAEGTIQKIQIKGNAAITVMPKGAKDLSRMKEPCLKAVFRPAIAENVVYSVSPVVTGSTYLMTPNWPDGMKPSSSVKWAVTVPQDYRAELMCNITTPKCASGQTTVEIRSLDAQEIQTWTGDQTVPPMIIQQQSFYLKMNNCESESKPALCKIILQRETKKFLGIILGIVGVLLLVLIIALIAICVIRRKNKPKANRSSIYIPKGTPVLPGNATFPKSRADNESHVYASIDDPMTYGHLLNEDRSVVDVDTGAWSNGHQVDTYRPFTGPKDSMPAVTETSEYKLDRADGRAGDAYQPFLNPANTFIPARPRTPLLSQSSLGFEDRRMAQNELNTFKSAGDINPIRLSADESRLQLQQDSDSDSFEPEYEEAM